MTSIILPNGADVELFVNELSVHGQFQDQHGFNMALSRLKGVREVAKRYGHEVQCQRTFFHVREAMPGVAVWEAVLKLTDPDIQQYLRLWFEKAGPFWDGQGRHEPNEYLECCDDVVTDTAVGEAAFRLMHGVRSGLVSIFPSAWNFTPVEVIWRREAEGDASWVVRVQNWWCAAALEDALQEIPPLRTWDGFRKAAIDNFGQLEFSESCFASLAGKTFYQAAAKRFWERLDILNRLSGAFGEDGVRTKEGHQMYQMHFTGDKAWFSDSSDTEKRRFREALTFPHPVEGAGSLFCPWHGKVSYLHLRLHFSGIPKAGEPVYVVYVGPKLTKR